MHLFLSLQHNNDPKKGFIMLGWVIISFIDMHKVVKMLKVCSLLSIVNKKTIFVLKLQGTVLFSSINYSMYSEQFISKKLHFSVVFVKHK